MLELNPDQRIGTRLITNILESKYALFPARLRKRVDNEYQT